MQRLQRRQPQRLPPPATTRCRSRSRSMPPRPARPARPRLHTQQPQRPRTSAGFGPAAALLLVAGLLTGRAHRPAPRDPPRAGRTRGSRVYPDPVDRASAGHKPTIMTIQRLIDDGLQQIVTGLRGSSSGPDAVARRLAPRSNGAGSLRTGPRRDRRRPGSCAVSSSSDAARNARCLRDELWSA